mmetsp:Transcript_29502/g.89645  ORF Transcript_29502/g.89645 Transcript_29502/m.89645 type:complete len:274 (-) Transcript_29502:145-966(-)
MRGRVHTPRARHGGFVAEGLRPLPWDLALVHGGSAHGSAHREESHSLRAVQARLSPRWHLAGKGGCLHGAGAVRLEVLHGATVRAAALPGQQTRGAWQRRPRAGGEDRSGDAITAEAPRNHACDRGQRRRRQHLLAQNPPARTNDQLLDARKVGRRPSTLGAVASATAGCAGRRAFRGAPAGAAPHHRPALERAALGGPVVDDEPLRVWRPAPRPGQLSHPPSAPGGLQHVYIPHQVRRFQGRQEAAGLGLHLHKQGVRRLHRARFRRDLLAV